MEFLFSPSFFSSNFFLLFLNFSLFFLNFSIGIIPALEPSHALYHTIQLAKSMRPDQDILINLCGRGDKDMMTVARIMGVNIT